MNSDGRQSREELGRVEEGETVIRYIVWEKNQIVIKWENNDYLIKEIKKADYAKQRNGTDPGSNSVQDHMWVSRLQNVQVCSWPYVGVRASKCSSIQCGWHLLEMNNVGSRLLYEFCQEFCHHTIVLFYIRQAFPFSNWTKEANLSRCACWCKPLLSENPNSEAGDPLKPTWATQWDSVS